MQEAAQYSANRPRMGGMEAGQRCPATKDAPLQLRAARHLANGREGKSVRWWRRRRWRWWWRQRRAGQQEAARSSHTAAMEAAGRLRAGRILPVFLILHLCSATTTSNSPWATWWDYEGVAGPQHWGIINPEWRLCSQGKFQSPIDIRPQHLLFDPSLRRMNLHLPDSISGTLVNTGNDVSLRIDDGAVSGANFSDGPLMYTYRLTQLVLHFGKSDTNGSEHSVDGNSFAAEIQFIAYNSDLYKSMSDAIQVPYGIAIIAVFVEVGEEDNEAFRILVEHAKQVPWQGQKSTVQKLPVWSLLPDTNYYLTYEGSLTQPACHETVTWVLFNKPVYVDKQQLNSLRQLRKRLYGEETVTQLAGNHRPTMPLNNRAVRTNINYPTTGDLCNMKKITFYEVNPTLTV